MEKENLIFLLNTQKVKRNGVYYDKKHSMWIFGVSPFFKLQNNL